MTIPAPVVVIGATGKIGSRVLARLESRGIPAYPASRRTKPAFDWENEATWAATLAGAGAAFVSYLPDLAAKGAPEAIAAFAQTAIAAGLGRVVLLSGRGEANAQKSEQILLTSGLACSVVRASWFNQNFTEGTLLRSVLSGLVAMPAGECREPFVDANDIADVAVAALTGPKPAGEIYEVTGPRLLTFAEAVSIIGAVSGRKVEYLPVSLEQFYRAVLPELGPDYAEMLTRLCEEVFDGRNESIGDGVQRALGRSPRDFADFCTEAAATAIWGQAA